MNGPPRLRWLAAAAALAVGCTVSTTAPHAYQCSADADCTGGWMCAGDGYCHDPAVGVSVSCERAPCPGGWLCGKDLVCHDPAVGRPLPCARDADCPGQWRCAGDSVCRDPALGVTVTCKADGDCMGGWRCTADHLCRDPAVGVTLPCAASTDCTGGWMCTLDQFCRDPAVGVTLPCAASSDCTGGWMCTLDQFCRDPDAGVAVACATSRDCPGGFRCTNDRLCRDPALGATVPCAMDADCTGGWRCTGDLLCHDPATGLPLRCTVSADCTGGWFCGKDLACHDPAVPAPLSCDLDAHCPLGRRCNTEGTCVDVSAERGLLAGAALGLTEVTARATDVAAFGAGPLQTEVFDGGPDVLTGSAAIATASRLELVQTRATLGTQRRDVVALGASTALSTPPLAVAAAAGQALAAVGTPVSSTLLWLRLDGGVTTLSETLTGDVRLGVVEEVPPTAPVSFVAVAEKGAVVLEPSGDLAYAVMPSAGADFIDATAVWVSAQGSGGKVSDAALAGYTTYAIAAPSTGGCVSVYSQAAGSTAVTVDTANMPVAFVEGGASSPVKPGMTCVPLRVRNTNYGLAELVEVDGHVVVIHPNLCLTQYCPLIPQRPQTGLGCPFANEELLEFDLAAGGFTDVTCRTAAGRVAAYRLTPSSVDVLWQREAPAFTAASGHHLATLTVQRGVTWAPAFDASPLTSALTEAPLALSVEGGAPKVVAASGLFESTPGRVLWRSTWSLGQPQDPAGFVSGAPTQLVEASGRVVDRAQAFRTVFLPLAAPSSAHLALAQVVRVTGRDGLLVAQGDAIFSGEAGPDGGVGTLEVRARPVPGGEVTSAALAPSDGGAGDGWVVANGRLFRLTGRAVDRWTQREVALTGHEPVAVWYSGARARVGTVSGEVLMLPERVAVTPPLASGYARSLAGACGASFALDDDGLWRAAPADGGVGAWEAVDAGPLPQLSGTALTSSAGRLFVTSAGGRVREVVSAGCP